MNDITPVLIQLKDILYDTLMLKDEEDSMYPQVESLGNAKNVILNQQQNVKLSNPVQRNGVNIIQVQSVVSHQLTVNLVKALKLVDAIGNNGKQEPSVIENKSNNLQSGERALIVDALEKNDWSQKDAAQVLGISPRSLNYRINKFGITHRRWLKNGEA
jgi:transcriptional regulator with GAF, ATPase, and Fis domain